MDYTVYIPKGIFSEGLSGIQLLTVAVIVLIIIVFFGYKFFAVSSRRRKPESF